MSLFELRSGSPALAARPTAENAHAAAEARSETRGTPWWTLLAIAVLAAAGFAAVNRAVLVNGDSVVHLVWGRELLDGTLSTFAGGPTPHPSLLVLGAGTSLLGDVNSYAVTYVLFGPAAFGVLMAAAFELGRRLSSRWAGAAAVLILGTSPGIVSVASAARYDMAFAALVMTAVALEMSRPRRGTATLACLAAAGLIRPEAWVLAAAYWLWIAPRLSWAARARMAALAALAPVLWSLMDVLVMGDPLYSLHMTDAASEQLYGRYTAWENLEVAGRNLVWFLGVLPLLLPACGVFMLARDRSRTAVPLLATGTITLGIFLILVARGMASSNRYLLVPVCALGVLAAVAVDGAGRRTRSRVAASMVLAVLLCLHLASRADVYSKLPTATPAASALYENVRALVGMPGVRQALRECPEVSVPAGNMRPWFSLYSGRAPEAFAADEAGRRHPDLFLAPGSPQASKAALTRARFDEDASFDVPAGLRLAVRNEDWALYVSPDSRCARGLR